jgi:transketolase
MEPMRESPRSFWSMETEVTLHEKESWHLGMIPTQAHSFVAGKVLADLADKDDRIVVLTADLGYSNRTIEFAKLHRDRFIDLGIAEHNMISVAAGLAASGAIPYVATFASFLALLCCEQIRTDLAYPNLPVRLISHHAGISLGYYGTSHHATEDIAVMRSMANMKIVCPVDPYSLEQSLRQTVDVEGPIYFRIGRGRDTDIYRPGDQWEFGKIRLLRNGKDGLVISNGIMVAAASQAADLLAKEGIELTVADLHTLRPLDSAALLSLLKQHKTVFVAEEHNTFGGVATIVADAMVDAGVTDVQLVRIGFPSDQYAIVGPPYYLYKYYGLDAAGVAARIRKTLKQGRS